MTRASARPAADRPQPLQLADDPVPAFRQRAHRDHGRVVRLAARLRNLSVWSHIARPLAELEDIAHGLAGASGVFGYPALGEAAAKVERLAERWRLEAPATLSPRRRVLLANATRSLIAGLELREGVQE
jgi:HPt (histidine-containing phosphotransfer) domain-containing protein